MNTLSTGARYAVLAACIGGLIFDGVELGLMPVASLSVSKSLLGDQFTKAAGGDWFARFTAALMLGAAIGGVTLGRLGDAIGRARAMGVSILFYSLFAGLGAFVTSQEQMLILRFCVGLGVGGVWPNAVALVSECWPNQQKPTIAGLMGAALNSGILLLSQVAQIWKITPDSWRWIFYVAAAPTILGLLVLLFLPESPSWLEESARRRNESERDQLKPPGRPVLRELFRPPILKSTILGILLGSIPLIGAWAASKWMIPWADHVAEATRPGYKAIAQGWWALGAVLGSFVGAQIAALLGRRRSYVLISIGATGLTLYLFLGTAPLQPSFLPVVFAQAFVTTLFFGWLPLYLPQLFPTHVRATGTGIAYNSGRFATAFGVLAAGAVFTLFDASYPRVGAICGLIYSLGVIVMIWVPDKSGESAKTLST